MKNIIVIWAVSYIIHFFACVFLSYLLQHALRNSWPPDKELSLNLPPQSGAMWVDLTHWLFFLVIIKKSFFLFRKANVH